MGFHRTTPEDTVREFVASGVGGIIYFTRNIDSPAQMAELSRSLQRAADGGGNPPLPIAVDEEGGIVSQLPREGDSRDRWVGKCGDPVLAKRAAAAKGCELRAIGVNVNLAPPLDVNNNPDNPLIDDPDYPAVNPAALLRFVVSTVLFEVIRRYPAVVLKADEVVHRECL